MTLRHNGKHMDGEHVDPTPSRPEQMVAAARDGVSRRELTNMLFDLSHVHSVIVDGDEEQWRDTTIAVMFDDKGYRDTSDVIDIMRAAGWQVASVTFAPYNRLTFEEVAA